MKSDRNLRTTFAVSEYMKFELLPGIPIIEICDQERVLIENHRGIIGYGCNEVRVKVRYGCVCVCGHQLKLMRMSKTKLVITGKICGVTLQG